VNTIGQHAKIVNTKSSYEYETFACAIGPDSHHAHSGRNNISKKAQGQCLMEISHNLLAGEDSIDEEQLRRSMSQSSHMLEGE